LTAGLSNVYRRLLKSWAVRVEFLDCGSSRVTTKPILPLYSTSFALANRPYIGIVKSEYKSNPIDNENYPFP
jgi:hypothetical protein